MKPHPESSTDPLFDGPGEVAALMRATDWSATALGPSHAWPRSLRTAIRIMLTTRFSMWMGWGPGLHFFYNDAYRPTLGTKHPQSLGMPFKELWSEIWTELEPRITNVLTGGPATWDEGLLLFLERNGYPEETYHTFSYSPLPDDDGGIGGMLSVVTEETDRVIGERRIALLRDIATQLGTTNTDADVFAAVDRTLGTGTRDIPFALTFLFGEDHGEGARLVSRCGFVEGHPSASPLAWPLESLRTTRDPVVVELGAGRWPAGPWTRAPARALLLPIAQQGQDAAAGVFIAGLNPYRPFDDPYRDFLRLFVGQISAGLANARAYESERRRARALAEIDRAKTAFFSNVSHEFRTPLTLMLGPLSEMAGDRELPAEAREQLSLAHRNALRLLKLVNTMLDFSRIEAGRAQANVEPVDLATVTADLASVFRSATDKAGLRLLVETEPLAQPVHVDRDMWEKVVFNLLSNAFKFTLQGEIAVSVRGEGDHALLSVRDTGTGIPAGEIPFLFDRFHRVTGTKGRSYEGTGIGLALVHELVKLHGGRIEVQSELGRGTTFTVAIPFGTSHLPPERIRASATAAAPHGPNPFVEEALRWLPDPERPEQTAGEIEVAGDAKGHVLLADDNADIREYIRRLIGWRWSMETVSNGQEALDAMRRRKPDLLITDAMMPVLDGFGLMRAIEKDDSLRGVPVLMLSARAGEEARVEALQAGANDYMVKPFSARELTARVDAMLIRHRIRTVEEERDRHFRSVFSQAPVAIAILSGAEHRFELANPSYRALLGNRDVVGKPILEAIPELAGQPVLAVLDEVFATGKPFTSRGFPVVLERDGTKRDCFFDLVYQPISEDERIVGIAAVGFEVTDLIRAREDAENANRSKDEFLAMLGHELRNPLAPIFTALHLMALRGTGADKERAVIERQVRHLASMVDDLLDVSRVTRGKIELRKTTIEVADAIAQAIETASPLLEQQRHTLEVDVPRTGLLVDADPARLSQVIANLLTNAAKYTPEKGRVRVTAAAEGDRVVILVRDSGIGIEPDMLARIFEPFAQERQAIDRAHGGLGLGLAIVRSIMALHGGTVSASSEGRGRGSQFEVTLPRSRAAARAFENRPLGAPATKVAPAKKILIVDDNRDAASTLAEMLAADGHDVRFAHDGPSGLALAAKFIPDIAILDIGLPVMDGYEVATRFAAHENLEKTRLIALTGYGQNEDRERTAAAGFAAHLVKPVEPDALRLALT